MDVDRNGLEVLDREECLRLLSGETVGRVALSHRALPMVLPVNYRLDGERILVGTGRGSKLDAAISDEVVAFEVDDFEPGSRTGWSVVVTGVARVLDDPAEVARLQDGLPDRWAPRGGGNLVWISTELMSGRRIPQGVGGTS
jgi:nitroimidazol reductase NimA-like FMN-containing flavoprotein (pyridoxamine 5'-phosphate oxidase superfamily)